MTTTRHLVHIEPATGGYRAVCTCGWTSARHEAYAAADKAASGHLADTEKEGQR